MKRIIATAAVAVSLAAGLFAGGTWWGRRGGAAPDRPYQAGVDQMLGDEPDLELVGPDHVADEDIVGAVIAGFGGLMGHRARLQQNDLVRMEQARDLDGHLFATPGWTRDQSHLRHVGRHGDADTAQHHDPLGDQVHQLALLVEVLVEQQVQRVEGGAGYLPVVLLVQVAERDGVREQLVEVGRALPARGLGESDRHGYNRPKGLDLVGALARQRRRAANDLRGCRLIHFHLQKQLSGPKTGLIITANPGPQVLQTRGTPTIQPPLAPLGSA